MSTSTSTVMKPLTLEERAEHADRMARLLALIAGIEDDAKAYAKKRRVEIDEHMAELQRLRFEVLDGAEETSQLDLFEDQASDTQALAEVARHACSCEGGPEAEVKSSACPVHGVTARGDNPAGEDEALAADAALAAEVAAAAEAPEGGDPETAEFNAMFPREDDAAEESSNVVDMAEALRAAEVNVGTVEEPGAAKAFRRGRKRA